MAVVVTKKPSGLKLRYDCGKDDETGKSIVKSKTYANISPDALDQDVYDVAAAISSLQSNTLLSVSKIDTNTLSE